MKAFFLFLAALFIAAGADAQAMADPSKWTLKVSPGDAGSGTLKKGEKFYRLEFIVELKPGWHIYALDPGGDGTLIPPSFTFKDSAAIGAEPMVEGGRPEEETMEGIDGKVRMFTGRASFFTTVSAKRKQVIKGTYTYQLCNDKMCLPPKAVPFVCRIP